MGALGEFGLDGSVVLVTGAGKGIGFGIAVDAARSGASVVACSRTDSDLTHLSEVIGGFGGTCRTVRADVTDAEDRSRLLDVAEESFGRIDALVNNAGANRLRDAVDYEESEVEALIGLNLTAVYWMSVGVAKRMIPAESGGTILNITSQAGVVAAPGRSPYSAAKAGVNHLTRSLAAEWAPHGIRVNALAPTVTATPLGIEAMAQRPALAAEVAERIVLRGRAATIEEITRPAVFLLSEASSLITGQTLVVDGGWTL